MRVVMDSRWWAALVGALALVAVCGVTGEAAAQPKKMAMIMPGPIEDGDFNALGYGALQSVGKKLGLAVSHSEKVAVADAERVAREYLGGGAAIVAFHGGQYLTIVQKMATQFPDATFIIVSQGKNLPPNVWNINRHFHEGFYPLGVLAALATKSNKIAFISGIRLPDFIASLNAAYTAIREVNPKAEVRYAFVGDQNDPLKARQSAESMIAEGADVIISALNQGVFGLIEAVKAAPRPVIATSFYTNTHAMAPQVFGTSLLLDFDVAYGDVVGSIVKGQRGGQYVMRPGRAMSLAPINNVPAEVAKRVEASYREVVGGKAVPEIIDKIIVP